MKIPLLFRRIWLILSAIALCACLLCGCTGDRDEATYVGTSSNQTEQAPETTDSSTGDSSDSILDSGENGTLGTPIESSGSSGDHDPWLPDKNWILP